MALPKLIKLNVHRVHTVEHRVTLNIYYIIYSYNQIDRDSYNVVLMSYRSIVGVLAIILGIILIYIVSTYPANWRQQGKNQNGK